VHKNLCAGHDRKGVRSTGLKVSLRSCLTTALLSFDIDPADFYDIVARGFTTGSWRSVNGPYGPWTSVLTVPSFSGPPPVPCAGGSAQVFVKSLSDKNNPNAVFALSLGTSGTLYYSGNNGALNNNGQSSFTPRTDTIAEDYASHPTNAGEGIVANSRDVYFSINYLFSKALGLAQPGVVPSTEGGFSAVAYDPVTPTTVLVGGNIGGIYMTTNYNTVGTLVTWTKLTTPLSKVTIRNIVIVHRKGNTYYYAPAHSGDVYFSPGTTPGLYVSINNGDWTAMQTGLLPRNSVWKVAPLGTSTNTFVGAMYGGSGMKLTYNQ
jgi:hypothetical protein